MTPDFSSKCFWRELLLGVTPSVNIPTSSHWQGTGQLLVSNYTPHSWVVFYFLTLYLQLPPSLPIPLPFAVTERNCKRHLPLVFSDGSVRGRLWMCTTRAAQAEFSDLGTFDFNLYRQNTYRGKMFQDTVIAGHTCWTFCTGFFFFLFCQITICWTGFCILSV